MMPMKKSKSVTRSIAMQLYVLGSGWSSTHCYSAESSKQSAVLHMSEGYLEKVLWNSTLAAISPQKQEVKTIAIFFCD